MQIAAKDKTSVLFKKVTWVNKFCDSDAFILVNTTIVTDVQSLAKVQKCL